MTMKFYVVDPLDPGWPLTPINTDPFLESQSITSAIWIPFPRTIDPHQLDYFLANSCPSFALRSDLIIIGLHPDSVQKVLNNEDILDDIERRVEDASLSIVFHKEGRVILRQVRGPRVEGLESISTIDRICEHDVASILQRPGAELPAHPGLHYIGPNGDHYEAFLRPGFAIQAIEELDRLAFWLAPKLQGRSNILVDHRSMIAVAYHAGHYLSKFFCADTIRVQSLRAYDETRDALSRRLEASFAMPDPETGAVLLSVNSSGRLAHDVLLPAMRDIGFRDPVPMAIARTPSDPEFKVSALTTLSGKFGRYKPSDCPICAKGESTLIPIQDDSYLLNLSAFVQTTAITRAIAKVSREMVERYSGIDAFSVHRTHSDQRHHAYHIDLLPMLRANVFCRRLTETAQPWRNVGIDLIIHPNHNAAMQLALMLAKNLDVKNILCVDERLQSLTCKGKNAVLSARRICLVDDVVISGARVFGYRNTLNRMRREAQAGDVELYCFVGVARTRHERALMGISDMFHHTPSNPRFLSVERIFLPNWNETECPWCAEFGILRKIKDKFRGNQLIRDRLDGRLERLSDPGGITDDLFLSWPSGPDLNPREPTTGWPNDNSDYAEREWELGAKSVFGEVQGADLAVSVAAAVQRLRGKCRNADSTWQESRLDEIFRSPLAKVLEPELYLAGRYYEPVLVATILRAAKRHDIRAPGNDIDLERQIKILVEAKSSRVLYGELALAAKLNQIPRSSFRTIQQAAPEMEELIKAMATLE